MAAPAINVAWGTPHSVALPVQRPSEYWKEVGTVGELCVRQSFLWNDYLYVLSRSAATFKLHTQLTPLIERRWRWDGHVIQEIHHFPFLFFYSVDNKVRKKAKIRNRYNQAPYLTKDTNGKVTTSQYWHHKRKPRGQLFPRLPHFS